MSLKSPLNIYVVWHPNFIDGANLANTIFSTFNRKVTEPLSRGIGIPVYFRSTPINSNVPTEIDFNLSEITIVIFLIDNALTISPIWHTYINNILRKLNSNSLVLPVAVTKEAFNIPVDFGKLNFIRLYNLSGPEREQLLLVSLTHEICRFLYRSTPAPAVTSTAISSAPVRIFLSHSKHDKCNKGEKLAIAIRDFIYSVTPMKAFFDVNDIAPGHDFETEITANIERMVFLCIHTDTYSGREYCRKEVLTAKVNCRPIVLLNALDRGESRSFPYMSNVPTIKVNIDMGGCPIISKFDVGFILFSILIETLRFRFQELFIEQMLTLFKTAPAHRIEKVPFSPELLYINNIAKKMADTIVYPDPPLGTEEIEVLEKFSTNAGYTCDYLTPTLLPLKYI